MKWICRDCYKKRVLFDAKRAFGEKGSYLSSAMISFTQIGWFGVGVAMFAIPVSGELLGGSKAAMWLDRWFAKIIMK